MKSPCEAGFYVFCDFLSFSAHSDSLEKSIQDDTEEVNENDLEFNGL